MRVSENDVLNKWLKRQREGASSRYTESVVSDIALDMFHICRQLLDALAEAGIKRVQSNKQNFTPYKWVKWERKCA